MTDHADRLRRLQERLPELEVDALLVTNLVNVRYLTGFAGTNGQVFVDASRAVFLTDPRYEARSATLVHAAEIAIYQSRLVEGLTPLLAPLGVRRLGVEAKTMTIHERDDLDDRLESTALVPTVGVIEGLRRSKDPEEIERLRRAVRLGDEVFGWILDRLVPGATERQIALDLELRMRELGADEVSFPPIVGSGELSAHIHHTPTDRELQKGDLVLLDFGCRLDGYCSDLTRTVILGSASPTQRDMYGVVLEAQRAGIEAVGPGVPASRADAAARSVIVHASMGDRFGHGLGHGVGLEIHEDPRLSRISEDVLAPFDAVTVEPGIYVQGEGGIRIEDCVVVTDSGHDVLGSAPKQELIEL